MIDLVNLERVRKDVAECGRDVVLIGASKTQSKETVDEFMRLAPDFVLGENRVQELLAKYDPRYEWHFIGRLQTNKVKYIVDKVALIHSLDRYELAREIDRQAGKINKIQRCLVEVNMGGEASKGGIEPSGTEEFIRSLKDFSNIRIEGIMSVMPNLGDSDALNSLYGELYGIFGSARGIKQSNVDIKYLSAGMSGDYGIALAHGSNMIRLGRILFGERDTH